MSCTHSTPYLGQAGDTRCWVCDMAAEQQRYDELRKQHAECPMPHFNGLTPKEDEALSLMAEECAEVIQIVEKIKRHGLQSIYKETSNRALLERELADVECCIQILIREDIVWRSQIDSCRVTKINKFRGRPELLHHLEPL